MKRTFDIVASAIALIALLPVFVLAVLMIWASIGRPILFAQARPGITGPATLKYRDEAVLLATHPDPERYNREMIWPDKVRLNLQYIREWSLIGDIRYIIRTVSSIY